MLYSNTISFVYMLVCTVNEIIQLIQIQLYILKLYLYNNFKMHKAYTLIESIL